MDPQTALNHVNVAASTLYIYQRSRRTHRRSMGTYQNPIRNPDNLRFARAVRDCLIENDQRAVWEQAIERAKEQRRQQVALERSVSPDYWDNF